MIKEGRNTNEIKWNWNKHYIYEKCGKNVIGELYRLGTENIQMKN